MQRMWLEFSQSGRCSSCMMLHCWHICWIPHFEGLICLTRNDARPCNTSPELQNWQKSRLQMKSNVSPSPLCQAVTLDQVMSFIERQPPYDVATSFTSFSYWSVFMQDSPIAPLGKILSALPASQAMVERVFSSADADGKERTGRTCLQRILHRRF